MFMKMKRNNDIRNIRPNGIAPQKLCRAVNGKVMEINKAYRIINGMPVVVWNTGSPVPPVISGIETVWNIQTSDFQFPAISSESVNGIIDWGDGTYEDYTSSTAFSHSYTENGIFTVTVKCDISSIKDEAFIQRNDLLKIRFPYGINSIGNYAFSRCTSLNSVILPDSLSVIGAAAFHYTSALEKIKIPDNVSSIGNAAFWTSGIVSITIPEGIASITSMFDHCYNLVSVTLPQSLTNIGQYSFNYCTSLKSIDIPSNVNTILYNAFSNTSDITIRIHKAENSISGKPWGALRANVIWVG